MRSPWARPLTAGAFALALGAGCSVGPDYKAPNPALPGAWHESATEVASPASARSPVDLRRWWAALNDPALDSLVERSIAGSLDLREAAARVAEARALRGVAASELFPTVDAAGAYSRSRASETAGFVGGGGGADEPRDLYQAGFDASWEIDVFGRVRRSVEAADADVQAAEEGRRDVLVTLLAEVARNYVELRGFQQRLLIAQDNIRVQTDSLDLARSRYQAGLTSELDTARAEAQLASTRSQVPVLEAGVRQTVHRLGVLLGQEPGSLLEEFAASGAIPEGVGAVPVGLPSEILRRRPDIRRAERELAGATARIGQATADLFPRFSLTGTFGVESSQFGNLFQGDSRFWSFGPAVRWPVFEAGRIQSNIRVQDARTAQAAVRYERSVLTALEEVENALVAYGREQVRRRSLQEAVGAGLRAVDLAGQLYTRGLTDFLSVLDAQRALYVLQDQLVQSDQTVTVSLISLYKALGGGWDDSDSPPAKAGSGG